MFTVRTSISFASSFVFSFVCVCIMCTHMCYFSLQRKHFLRFFSSSSISLSDYKPRGGVDVHIHTFDYWLFSNGLIRLYTSEYASSLHKLPGYMSGTYELSVVIRMLYVYGTHYVFTPSDLFASSCHSFNSNGKYNFLFGWIYFDIIYFRSTDPTVKCKSPWWRCCWCWCGCGWGWWWWQQWQPAPVTAKMI